MHDDAGAGVGHGRASVLEAAVDMPAHLWYDQYAATTPELQTFARLVLSQPASASICERINSEWSEFASVKDRRRNRLKHEKANKLVGLFHNLRLMARMNKTAYTEPAVGWLEDTDTKAGIKKMGHFQLHVMLHLYELCIALPQCVETYHYLIGM